MPCAHSQPRLDGPQPRASHQITNLGSGVREDGVLPSSQRVERCSGRVPALWAPTPHMHPRAPGAGAQPTYMSAGRGPDAGLAAGSGAAAAGAVPGRRRPSSCRRGSRAGRSAVRAAPPARSARRVHPARAAPRACPARCPTHVRARAALRRSAPGLVPAAPPPSAPWGRRARPRLLQPRGAGRSPRQVTGGRAAAARRREPGEARSAAGGRPGEWHRAGQGARAPASRRLPPRALPAPSAAVPAFSPGVAAAAWRRGESGTSRPLAPAPGSATHLSVPRAAACPPRLPFSCLVTHSPLRLSSAPFSFLDSFLQFLPS